ncbi:MAG: DNA repair protein RecO [bacterium]|nr:DNA repair protein RecO [bacterium]
MQQARDQAFVLRTMALGDADLIVTLLTEQHGKVRAVARSARRSRKRFGGLLEPMTQVQAAWSEKAGRELHRLDELDAVRSFAAMQADPATQAVCACLSEISDQFVHMGEAEPKSFRLLRAALEALESGAGAWMTVRYFEYWTLRLHGLLPDLSACAECEEPLAPERARHVLRGHGVVCATCAAAGEAGQSLLGQPERGLLELLRTRPPRELPRASDAARPGGAVETLLRGTLEAFAERRLRSYRHLRAALDYDGTQGDTA